MSTYRWSLRLPRTALRLQSTKAYRGTLSSIPKQHWQPSRVARSSPAARLPQQRKQASSQQPPQEQNNAQQPPQPPQQNKNELLATTLAQTASSDLLSEVHIPHDPHGVLPPEHPALSILGNSSLVIQRQIELMNLMVGFEQANRYIIMDGAGNTLGYIAEQDHGIGSAMKRQMFKTHRSFTTHIFDAQEREVLRIHRPFAYINSRIRIYDCVPEGGYEAVETSTALQGLSAGSAMQQGATAQVSPLKLEDMRIIGEAQQQWAPLRRKYNLFTYRPLSTTPDDAPDQPRLESGDKPTSTTTALTTASAPDAAIEAGMAQFAHVSEPFLSWDFTLRDAAGNTIGSVNRNFGGFAREIFTDTGVYALRMDAAAQSSALEGADGREVQGFERDATAMTLDQRAVMLATAVSVDFDYFSRHSHAGGGGGFMPLWFPWWGGGAAEGAGAAGAEGAAGAGAAGAGEAGAGVAGAGEAALGRAGVGAGSEGAIAGAGTMAGYEAMQRGVYGPRGGNDDASPQTPGAAPQNEPFRQDGENRPGDEVWGEEQDTWGGKGQDDGDPWGGDGGGDVGGGDGGDFGDWF